MTGETTNNSVGGTTVKRRSRSSSLAAPAACDLYRRSFSESPHFASPRATRRPPIRSHSVKVRKTPTAPEFDVASRWYCYRVRSFTLNSRGIINRGDSVRYRQAPVTAAAAAALNSAETVPDSASPVTQKQQQQKQQETAAAPINDAEPEDPELDIEAFRVQLMGATGVGKTALCNQFLTSEHVFVKSNLPEISLGERDVTVLLNGEESRLMLIDGTKTMSGEENEAGDVDGYLVIYSVASRESFDFAKKILQELRAKTSNKTIVLIGNKSDLVRGRIVAPEEGRAVASSMGIKCIETSVGINYHVDDLLVGTLAQMRLRQRGRGKASWPSLQKASFRMRKLLHRLMGKDAPPSPCDMLHAL